MGCTRIWQDPGPLLQKRPRPRNSKPVSIRIQTMLSQCVRAEAGGQWTTQIDLLGSELQGSWSSSGRPKLKWDPRPLAWRDRAIRAGNGAADDNTGPGRAIRGFCQRQRDHHPGKPEPPFRKAGNVTGESDRKDL